MPCCHQASVLDGCHLPRRWACPAARAGGGDARHLHAAGERTHGCVFAGRARWACLLCSPRLVCTRMCCGQRCEADVLFCCTRPALPCLCPVHQCYAHAARAQELRASAHLMHHQNERVMSVFGRGGRCRRAHTRAPVHSHTNTHTLTQTHAHTHTCPGHARMPAQTPTPTPAAAHLTRRRTPPRTCGQPGPIP